MKVHVDYECKDWEDYCAFSFTQPLYRKHVLKHFFKYALGTGLLFGIIQLLLTGSFLYFLAVSVGLTAVFYFSYYAMRQRYFQQWARKYWKSSPEHRTFELNAEGLRIQDKDFNALVYWSKIGNVFYSHGHIFFEQSGTGFYQIPVRAFPDPDLAHVFFETAKTFKSGKQPGGAWWTQGTSVTTPESQINTLRN